MANLAATNTGTNVRQATMDINGNQDVFGSSPQAAAALMSQANIRDAAAQAQGTLTNTLGESLGYLGTSFAHAQSVLQPGVASNRAALNSYFKALGIPTPDQDAAAARAGVLQQLRDTPGYQFAAEQGLEQIQRNAASKGYLNSGRTLTAAQQYETGLADQTYQSFVNNLATSVGLTNPFVTQSANLFGQQGVAGASITSSLGQAMAGIQNQLGQDLSSIQASLSGGQTAQGAAGGGAGGGGAGGSGALGVLGQYLGGMIGMDVNPSISNPTYYSNQGGNGMGGVAGYGGGGSGSISGVGGGR